MNLKPSSARVYIDGKSPTDLGNEDSVTHQRDGVGTLTFSNLAPGTHNILATRGGYNVRKKHVSIEPNDRRIVDIELHSRWKFFIKEMAFFAVVSALGIGVYFIVTTE